MSTLSSKGEYEVKSIYGKVSLIVLHTFTYLVKMVNNFVVNGGSEIAHLTAVRKLSLIMTFPHVGY